MNYENIEEVLGIIKQIPESEYPLIVEIKTEFETLRSFKEDIKNNYDGSIHIKTTLNKVLDIEYNKILDISCDY